MEIYSAGSLQILYVVGGTGSMLDGRQSAKMRVASPAVMHHVFGGSGNMRTYFRPLHLYTISLDSCPRLDQRPISITLGK